MPCYPYQQQSFTLRKNNLLCWARQYDKCTQPCVQMHHDRATCYEAIGCWQVESYSYAVDRVHTTICGKLKLWPTPIDCRQMMAQQIIIRLGRHAKADAMHSHTPEWGSNTFCSSSFRTSWIMSCFLGCSIQSYIKKPVMVCTQVKTHIDMPVYSSETRL